MVEPWKWLEIMKFPPHITIDLIGQRMQDFNDNLERMSKLSKERAERRKERKKIREKLEKEWKLYYSF